MKEPCRCQSWCRTGKIYGRTKDGIPIIENHHPNCEHYNDTLIDVWVARCDGMSYVSDVEIAPEHEDETITKEKMHLEVYVQLREFDGF